MNSALDYICICFHRWIVAFQRLVKIGQFGFISGKENKIEQVTRLLIRSHLSTNLERVHWAQFPCSSSSAVLCIGTCDWRAGALKTVCNIKPLIQRRIFFFPRKIHWPNKWPVEFRSAINLHCKTYKLPIWIVVWSLGKHQSLWFSSDENESIRTLAKWFLRFGFCLWQHYFARFMSDSHEARSKHHENSISSNCRFLYRAVLLGHSNSRRPRCLDSTFRQTLLLSRNFLRLSHRRAVSLSKCLQQCRQLGG